MTCEDPDLTLTDDYVCTCPACKSAVFTPTQTKALTTFLSDQTHETMARHVVCARLSTHPRVQPKPRFVRRRFIYAVRAYYTRLSIIMRNKAWVE